MAKENDARKIAFVLRAGARLEEHQRYLAALRVPDGMTAEVVTVDGTDAEVAALYNEAQVASDARYKVYLAPDAVILHEKFRADVLAVFRAAPDVGIVGVPGARQLRTDGVFDHALGLAGRAVVHEGGDSSRQRHHRRVRGGPGAWWRRDRDAGGRAVARGAV